MIATPKFASAIGHRLTRDAASQPELGIVAGVIGPRAMAGRLATAARHHTEAARAKIAKALELVQELGSIRF